MRILFFSFVFFLLGLGTFPLLFYIQKLLKLPVPDLEKAAFHIHHSFYGLLLCFVGIGLLLWGKMEGVYLAAVGTGFMVHHEYTEPGLLGIEKFIYIKKKSP